MQSQNIPHLAERHSVRRNCHLTSQDYLANNTSFSYVGTLHSINSEDSTVSLENVRSYGTEGRKGNPDEEVPPSVELYEYIVFRGTDVKDLRIEEGPAAKENKPPAMPNDPAIVGVSSSLFPLYRFGPFMMNYFGCKNFVTSEKRKQTMLRFPLPSF